MWEQTKKYLTFSRYLFWHRKAALLNIIVYCHSRFSPLSVSLGVVAFHGLQLKIKRELHSPCSELSSTCSQERPFKLQYGEKCPYVRCAQHNTDWTLHTEYLCKDPFKGPQKTVSVTASSSTCSNQQLQLARKRNEVIFIVVTGSVVHHIIYLKAHGLQIRSRNSRCSQIE